MMDSDSENEPPPWDFRPVRRFLRAFDSEYEIPPNPAVPDPFLYDPKSTIPKSLGDFDRLFSFCGKSLEAAPVESHRRSNDSSSARSTGSTPPSSAPDDDVAHEAEHVDKHTSKLNGKEVRWKDQLGRNLTEVRRRSAHGSAGDFDAAVITRLIEDDGYESDTEVSGFRDPPPPSPVTGSRDKFLRSPTSNRRNASTELLPASVAPVQRPLLSRPPLSIPVIHLDPSVIQPLYTLTINEQKAKLVKKLLKKFPEESSDISNAISQLGNRNDDGIHIFVDCSNIVIGFYNQLRYNRNINPAAYVKQPPISYHSLALILERGRQVARRVLVGSNPRLRASDRHLLDHVQEAQAWGYEVNMLERVEKLRRSTPRKKKHGSGNGYATTSGQSSGSETPFAGVSVVAEQGVDEILQMKLLESLVDTHTPSTVVLASGDAAEAEFSGGFLKCVERALSKGWNVEIIAWGDGLSREYRSRNFSDKWISRFKIIELDDFCEEMLALQYLFRDIEPHSRHPLVDRIENKTLGFEKIFAIGLPERSDKRDALALTSSLTGFKVEWIDGVKGQTISDKALPFGVDRMQLWDSNLGSWRGHMNAVRRVVEEGISSALIIEDDVDWDVRLKSQLKVIALGAHLLQYPPSKSVPPTGGSPYGEDWDVLWLGHCGDIFPEQLEEYSSKSPMDPDLLSVSRKYTIFPDSTVPPPEHTRGFQNYSAYPYTRWVHISGGPICSFAYALSQQGARKVLLDLSVDHLAGPFDHLAGPFDNALAGLCRWGRAKDSLGMRCLSVTPPLFSHHKAKGVVSGDSDIHSIENGNVREIGVTENIVWSARRNIRGVMLGDNMEVQY